MSKYRRVPIGITGRNKMGGVAGAGKDLFTKLLIERYPGTFIKYSFADPMREIAEIFGFTRDQLLDPVKKETTDPFWNITPRKFMQQLGTDMFRNVWRQDVWIECARKFILDHPDAHVVIPDVRFRNEFEFIQSQGGIVIQVVRDNNPYDGVTAHISEFEVNNLITEGVIRPDIIIQNDKSEWDLSRAGEKFYLDYIRKEDN